MKVVLVTGGFDPVHSGHIAYFTAAKTLGDKLIVGLNSDFWLTKKKGRCFMPWDERRIVLESLNMVDHVLEFNDNDGTACNAIERILDIYGSVEFANGGDRNYENIPEMEKYGRDSRVKFHFSVGGDDKRNSSRKILEEWRSPKTSRDWGYYRVLYEYGKHTKLKEITVDPGHHLSMQRHTDRSELWFVSEGEATVYTINKSSDFEIVEKYKQHQNVTINKRQWHMLANETDMPLRIIEIQYGDNCIESDIERKYYEQS